jgi:hypothetical protein
MEIFSPLPDKLTPAPDTSNTVRVIGELCLKSPMNVVRVRAFPQDKPIDHSLLELDPAVENTNVLRRGHFQWLLLSRQAPECPALMLGRYTGLGVEEHMKLCLEIGGYGHGHYA